MQLYFYLNGLTIGNFNICFQINLEDEIDISQVSGSSNNDESTIYRIVLMKIGTVSQKITVLLRKYPNIKN